MNAILNGIPDSIKIKMEKCLAAKGMWGKLHDIHSKEELTMNVN